MALVKDHRASTVVFLTKKDTFFIGDEYNQLVYGCSVASSSSSSKPTRGQKVHVVSEDELELAPPAIWKPMPLWTGKQVITALINHITKGLPRYNTVEKELLLGVIDEAQLGLVHTIQELYGPSTAGKFLSAFSRLCTLCWQMRGGITCGVDEFFENHDKVMKEKLKECRTNGEKVLCAIGNTKFGEIEPLKLRMGAEKPLCRCGEMCRRPIKIVDKINKDSISGKFLNASRPQEYYLHCMAAHKRLVDTAINKSRSRYLQRCTTKNLEGQKVCYGNTVRDADRSEGGVDNLQDLLEKFDPGRSESNDDINKQPKVIWGEAMKHKTHTGMHKFGMHKFGMCLPSPED